MVHFQTHFFCLLSLGQLYGLEKFWAFLKYSKAKTLEIDPKLQEYLSKFKRLEDFRIDVSRIFLVKFGASEFFTRARATFMHVNALIVFLFFKNCCALKTTRHLIASIVNSGCSRLWRKEAAEDTHPAGMVAAGTPLCPLAGPTARPAQAPAPPPTPWALRPRMMPNPPAREPPPLTPHQMPRH